MAGSYNDDVGTNLSWCINILCILIGLILLGCAFVPNYGNISENQKFFPTTCTTVRSNTHGPGTSPCVQLEVDFPVDGRQVHEFLRFDPSVANKDSCVVDAHKSYNYNYGRDKSERVAESILHHYRHVGTNFTCYKRRNSTTVVLQLLTRYTKHHATLLWLGIILNGNLFLLLCMCILLMKRKITRMWDALCTTKHECKAWIRNGLVSFRWRITWKLSWIMLKFGLGPKIDRENMIQIMIDKHKPRLTGTDNLANDGKGQKGTGVMREKGTGGIGWEETGEMREKGNDGMGQKETGEMRVKGTDRMGQDERGELREKGKDEIGHYETGEMREKDKDKIGQDETT